MLKVKTNIRLQIRGWPQSPTCWHHPGSTFLWVLPILCLLVWRFKSSSGWRFNIFHLCKFPRAYIEWGGYMHPLYKGTSRPRPCRMEILIENGACDTWALSHRIKWTLLSLPLKFTFISLSTPVRTCGHLACGQIRTYRGTGCGFRLLSLAFCNIPAWSQRAVHRVSWSYN